MWGSVIGSREVAFPHVDVDVVDGARAHADERVARTRLRIGALLVLEERGQYGKLILVP